MGCKYLTLLGRRLAVALFLFPIVGTLPALAQTQISASAAAQIQALLQEKAARTPAQQKLDSQIIYNARKASGQAIANGIVSTFTPGVLETSTGLIHVHIKADVTPDLLNAITGLGGKVQSSFAQFHSIRAWLPLLSVETLAARADVHFIRPAEKYVTSSSVRSQLTRALPAFATTKAILAANPTQTPGPDTNGAKAHGASIAQGLGITGAGVKIGVLSDGVTSLASEQAAGRLPGVTVLSGQANSGPGPCPGTKCPDEGTAMLEIVYSMAPGAQLFFATADGSEAQFAANIQALQAAGCNIIVDDATYFAEPVFQDGIIAQAVNAVTAAGVLYLSSAGNSGNLDSNQSGTWEGDFVDGGGISSPEVGQIHSFGPSNYNVLTSPSALKTYLLQWSDPWGASCNDYDLYILNASGTAVIAASTTSQTCTQDPFEGVGATVPANSQIVIVKYSGNARALHLDTERGKLSIATTGATFGHNAAGTALTVAATNVANAVGSTFLGASQDPPETFSSDGPRKIFYDPNGNPLTPGNVLFSTNGGTTLAKVDFTAADGVTTGLSSASGFNPFYGTSAAAPHAAGVAALIMAANPSLTAAQIASAMKSTALSVTTPAGVQPRTIGAGIVMANLGINSVMPDITLTTSHTGSFTQGQTGAVYTITATNSGTGPTSGTTTVVDTLPSSLTATAMSGNGWSCTLATLTCTTSTVEPPGASFPPITLSVNVSLSAPPSVTNTATVSGGGANTSNNTANDPTQINAAVPDLTVTSTHMGNFAQGQSGAVYTLTVTNSGTGPTTGAVSIIDALPADLTATALTGSGWSCDLGSLTCTTTTVEQPGASFPAITLTVNVFNYAAGSDTNVVTVSGGGETNTDNNVASDPTNIYRILYTLLFSAT